MVIEKGLINDDGATFGPQALHAIEEEIGQADVVARTRLRNANSEAIAIHEAARMLIAAGPGTGKSFLFMSRIDSWAGRYGGQPVYVSSFVRKLILDLQQRVKSSHLPDEAKSLVTVSTLHTLARSVVERNNGTSHLAMARHIHMIGEEWKAVVWQDVLQVAPDGVGRALTDFEARYHELRFTDEEPWPTLHTAYERLCRFYNALGFADSIVLAAQALRENPDLKEHVLWIFDEFQDFNTAEEDLVRVCVDDAEAVLLAGDDDQAIYQSFKGSRPDIIRTWYRDPTVVNAMLPLCDRSSYHICMGAAGFLAQHGSAERIDKVFRPIDTASTSSSRIQVLVASKPWTAVAYIKEFMKLHEDEIAHRADEIRAGKSDESYLLVLSLNGDLSDYLGESGTELANLIDQWRLEEVGPGEDWKRVLLYYLHCVSPLQNFTLRKVLHLEGVSPARVGEALTAALESGLNLADVDLDEIREAREKCCQVYDVVTDDAMSSTEKAEHLADLLPVLNRDRLNQDLEAFRIGDQPHDAEEDVETVRFVSPVEFMTMFRAKGLSAEHVILVGADATNMGYATPELFYVALTRARTSLHLVIPLEGKGARAPHQFVLELPEAHCTYSKYLKSGLEPFENRDKFVSYFDQRLYRIRNMVRKR